MSDDATARKADFVKFYNDKKNLDELKIAQVSYRIEEQKAETELAERIRKIIKEKTQGLETEEKKVDYANFLTSINIKNIELQNKHFLNKTLTKLRIDNDSSITIRISGDGLNTLKSLKEDTDSVSYHNVVQNALAVYKTLIDYSKKGYKIQLDNGVSKPKEVRGLIDNG